MASGFRLPNPLELNDGNIAENYRKWRREVDVYLLATGASKKDAPQQAAIILHCAGSQMIDIFEQLEFDNADDRHKPDPVLNKIEEYCNPRKNEVLETFRFWNIAPKRPFSVFLQEIRAQADNCNFSEKDRMIRDKIVFSVKGKLQETLLREKDLSLTEAVEICRAYENSVEGAKEISASKLSNDQNIDKVAKYKSQYPPNATKTPRYRNNNWRNNCLYCGGSHKAEKEACPAWGKPCNYCKTLGHYESVCKKKKRVHHVDTEVRPSESEDSDDQWLSAIKSGRNDRITALMEINDRMVRFQVDSAADVNTICQRHVRKSQLTPTDVRLNMWNGTRTSPLGEAVIRVRNPKNGELYDTKFTVVSNGFTNLLGIGSIQEMGLISVNDKNIAKLEINKPLGNLGLAKLELDPNAKPKILPCRNIPLALKDPVKIEIDNLIKRGILAPVSEPTDWVSQMAVVKKANGKIRICIDPQPLNEALKREHFKLPTLEDVLPNLNKAKVFSKYDVKEAFWHIKLDEESQLLTTMITPWGRFKWLRLPFGLKPSSEIFQKRFQQSIEGLPGVACIADDVIVAGFGENMVEANENLEQNAEKLINRCKDRNINLNEEKASKKQTEIDFMGHKITANGILPDSSKVQAITDMPKPTDVAGIKRFCGMIQYLSKFLPNLASELEPMRKLTRKEVEFNWSIECDRAFETVKELVTKSPMLQYFDPDKILTVQVDSSKDGIGAVLMQNGKPIEYASRGLTLSERNWAQIEKEMLSLVFGLERFDQYTYGRPVNIENDHKPLESILKKTPQSGTKATSKFNFTCSQI